MQLTTSYTDAEVDAFLKEVMSNMPEYGLSLQCVSWKYDDCRFRFVDPENKTYMVDLPELRIGLAKMLRAMVEQGQMPIIYSAIKPDLLDGSNWDAEALDCLVQFSIFGEVIYG